MDVPQVLAKGNEVQTLPSGLDRATLSSTDFSISPVKVNEEISRASARLIGDSVRDKVERASVLCQVPSNTLGLAAIWKAKLNRLM
ncbi:hypothetical protein U1Q18_003313 [Sarracenia purpurea var. burkii]